MEQSAGIVWKDDNQQVDRNVVRRRQAGGSNQVKGTGAGTGPHEFKIGDDGTLNQ